MNNFSNFVEIDEIKYIILYHSFVSSLKIDFKF